MAINRLGGVSKWVELGSSSPTTGTSVSFTSLPEYREYAIQVYKINSPSGTATVLTVRLNNDTGTNYNRDATALEACPFSSNNAGFQMVITGANELYKNIEVKPFDGTSTSIRNMWHSSATINRIDILSSATFSAGTIKIFGRN